MKNWLVGIFDQNNRKGVFGIEYQGGGEIHPPVKSSGPFNDFIRGTCRMSGNTITMSTEESPNFYYPEFRDGSATLTTDGDTLITETGRRFIKDPSIP